MSPTAPKKITTTMEELRLGDLRLLEVNARYMQHATFQRLVENIARDGCLTQHPFAIYDKKSGPPLVLSGNHRVQAGIEALGEDHVDWIQTTRDRLPKARRLAIQLSHNAVTGEDDPAVLAALYEEIEGVDWKEYAGLDDETLDLLEDVKPVPLGDAGLEFVQVALSFFPEEEESLVAALDRADAIASGEHWAARHDDYERFLDALDLMGRSYGIKNIALGLRLIVDVFLRHVEDAQAGFLDDDGEPKHKGWVPLWVLFGGDSLPAPAAAVVKKAVQKMIDRDDLDADGAKALAIERWAADYLAGP